MNVFRHAALGVVKVTASGFSAAGAVPSAGNPTDWMAWHFSHRNNLSSIVSAGGLLSSLSARPCVSSTSASIKADRASTPVRLPSPYPQSTVGDHVPFYFAPRSPILNAILTRGDRASDYVFFGVRLGDIADAGLVWCATDGHARQRVTTFTTDISRLGEFIDLDALSTWSWQPTDPLDQDVKRRRQAELSVREFVPLAWVSRIACFDDESLVAVQSQIGDDRKRYHGADPWMYPTPREGGGDTHDRTGRR